MTDVLDKPEDEKVLPILPPGEKITISKNKAGLSSKKVALLISLILFIVLGRPGTLRPSI